MWSLTHHADTAGDYQINWGITDFLSPFPVMLFPVWPRHMQSNRHNQVAFKLASVTGLKDTALSTSKLAVDNSLQACAEHNLCQPIKATRAYLSHPPM